VKNAIFYIAHTRFIIVELVMAEPTPRKKPGGGYGFQKLCTWYSYDLATYVLSKVQE
jgi:hypothetical protein